MAEPPPPEKQVFWSALGCRWQRSQDAPRGARCSSPRPAVLGPAQSGGVLLTCAVNVQRDRHPRETATWTFFLPIITFEMRVSSVNVGVRQIESV